MFDPPPTIVQGKIACSNQFYRSNRATIPLHRLARRCGKDNISPQDKEDGAPSYHIPCWSLNQNFDWSTLSVSYLKDICKTLHLPSSSNNKRILVNYLKGLDESLEPTACSFIATKPKRAGIVLPPLDVISQLSNEMPYNDVSMANEKSDDDAPSLSAQDNFAARESLPRTGIAISKSVCNKSAPLFTPSQRTPHTSINVNEITNPPQSTVNSNNKQCRSSPQRDTSPTGPATQPSPATAALQKFFHEYSLKNEGGGR